MNHLRCPKFPKKTSVTPNIQNKFMMRNSFIALQRQVCHLVHPWPISTHVLWLDLWWHVCPIALTAVEYGIWIYGPWCCTIFNYALCITLPGESRYHLKVGMVESFHTGDLKVRVDWKAYVVHGPYGTNCPWSNLQKLLYNSIFY